MNSMSLSPSQAAPVVDPLEQALTQVTAGLEAVKIEDTKAPRKVTILWNIPAMCNELHKDLRDQIEVLLRGSRFVFVYIAERQFSIRGQVENLKNIVAQAFSHYSSGESPLQVRMTGPQSGTEIRACRDSDSLTRFPSYRAVLQVKNQPLLFGLVLKELKQIKETEKAYIADSTSLFPGIVQMISDYSPDPRAELTEVFQKLLPSN